MRAFDVHFFKFFAQTTVDDFNRVVCFQQDFEFKWANGFRECSSCFQK